MRYYCCSFRKFHCVFHKTFDITFKQSISDFDEVHDIKVSKPLCARILLNQYVIFRKINKNKILIHENKLLETLYFFFNKHYKKYEKLMTWE